MNRKRNILLLLAAAAMVGCGLCWWPARDPVYQGRRTSDWVEQAFKDPPSDAFDAVVKIGAPAVPFIVRGLHDRSHTFHFLSADKVMVFSYSHPRIGGWMMGLGNCVGKHERAAWLLRLMGTNAQSAIPDVIDCLENCKSIHAMNAQALLDTLGDISGADSSAIPYLTKRVRDNDGWSLRAAALAYRINGQTNLLIETCERLSREDPNSLLESQELFWYNDDRELNQHLVPLLETLFRDPKLDKRERALVIDALELRTNDAAAVLFCAVSIRNRENPLAQLQKKEILPRPPARVPDATHDFMANSAP
jgi:hypothetical protein